MTKIAGSGSESGSGSISQRHVSAYPDPDPHQNVMDLEHRLGGWRELGQAKIVSCKAVNVFIYIVFSVYLLFSCDM